MGEENIVSNERSQVPSALLPCPALVLMASPLPASPSTVPALTQAQAEGRLCILGLLTPPQHLIIMIPTSSLPSQ